MDLAAGVAEIGKHAQNVAAVGHRKRAHRMCRAAQGRLGGDDGAGQFRKEVRRELDRRNALALQGNPFFPKAAPKQQ